MRDLVNSSDKPTSPFHVCNSTPPRASSFAKARDRLPCLSGAFDCVVNLSPKRKQYRTLWGIEVLIQFGLDKAHFWTESRADSQHLDRPTGTNRGHPAISLPTAKEPSLGGGSTLAGNRTFYLSRIGQSSRRLIDRRKRSRSRPAPSLVIFMSRLRSGLMHTAMNSSSSVVWFIYYK
jgi:hypothetical protein